LHLVLPSFPTRRSSDLTWASSCGSTTTSRSATGSRSIPTRTRRRSRDWTSRTRGGGATSAARSPRGSASTSPARPSLSRVVLVLTLSMASKEGHPAYRSQSDNPLQGTTLGGSPDDPRRQRTRNAPAGHAPCAGARQRQCGVPRAGDLAHSVLPVAEAVRALRG